MKVVSSDKFVPEIWKEYKNILDVSGEKFNDFHFLERFDFYERAKNAYAVIATSEPAQYANIILTKGIVKS